MIGAKWPCITYECTVATMLFASSCEAKAEKTEDKKEEKKEEKPAEEARFNCELRCRRERTLCCMMCIPFVEYCFVQAKAEKKEEKKEDKPEADRR